MGARRSIMLWAGSLLLAAGTAATFPRHGAAQESRDPELTGSRVTPIVQVVRKVGPTVVNLYADLEIQGAWGMQSAGSLGSGVIVHPSGLVVTNAHVITGNSRGARLRELAVSYRPDWSNSQADTKKFKAVVLGFDRTNDLALLQIQAPGPFQFARLGTSSDLMIGETVVAVGNPLGREGSVTHGIVSATNRTLASPTGDEFDDMIQTDAPLNSGNSGGPLFNILGELVGINQAIAGDRQFGRAEGQGLALPVDRVRDLLGTEFNPVDLLHLWIGMDLDNAEGKGAVVRRVDRDGPAAKAGVQAGDVIVRVGDYEVFDRTSFNLSICSLNPDRPFPLVVLREGRRREIQIEPVYIDDAIAQRLGAGLSFENGALRFTSVKPSGPTAELGVREGDVLVELDGKPAGTEQDVFEILRRIDRGDEARVVIYRFSSRSGRRTLQGELKL